MPTPMSLRANSNIAFVPAASTPAGSAPPAASSSTTEDAASTIAFRPAGAVDMDALLDRFEPPPAGAAVSPAVSSEPEAFDRPILLFNGQCETCKVLSAWVKRTDAAGSDLIDERPIPSTPEELARLNPSLDIWKVYEEIHLLMPDGSVKTGGEAIGEVLRRLPNTGWYTWTFDVNLLGFKPGQLALDVAYKFLDAIRPALGCTSCGGGPVVWWAKPIKWASDAVKWALGNDAHKDATSPANA